jgi:hemerythrin superfamily protein
VSTGTRTADVVDLLLEQHARIEELFRDVLLTEGDARRESFEELTRLLAVHETAEEELVHPLARGSIDAGDDVVDAHLAEEHEAKETLAELYDLGTHGREFEKRLVELRHAVIAHARHEERYEFPQLRQAHSNGTLVAMAAAVRAAEAAAPTRPHPGVESATANAVLGPPAAVMDRARDLIRDTLKKK